MKVSDALAILEKYDGEDIMLLTFVNCDVTPEIRNLEAVVFATEDLGTPLAKTYTKVRFA